MTEREIKIAELAKEYENVDPKLSKIYKVIEENNLTADELHEIFFKKYVKETKKRYYTAKEASSLLNVNQDTIYRYLKSGKLESVKLGKSHYITTDSLEKVINTLAETTI